MVEEICMLPTTMTLRDAARRSERSVTTLRRYIRSGRLKAEKRLGRFGPEYFVSEDQLNEAGLEIREDGPLVAAAGPPVPAQLPPAHYSIPVTLFQELQMKHEQLLVQYGMVRVGGMRVMELRAELESKQRELTASEARIRDLTRKFNEETDRLKNTLRKVEFEQEGRGLEIGALREKVRALEILTRNSTRTESIEQQFSEVLEQMRRVDQSGSDRTPDSRPDLGRRPRADETPDH